MKLSDLLTPDQILLGFTAADKWDAIEAMAAALVRCGRLPESRQREAADALVARERKLTTGMEDGVAIPHAALDDLPELLAVLCIAPDGIDFAALDGEPGRILVGLLLPRAEKLLHIRTLAEIAGLLSQPGTRARLLASATPAAALAAIRAAE